MTRVLRHTKLLLPRLSTFYQLPNMAISKNKGRKASQCQTIEMESSISLFIFQINQFLWFEIEPKLLYFLQVDYPEHLKASICHTLPHFLCNQTRPKTYTTFTWVDCPLSSLQTWKIQDFEFQFILFFPHFLRSQTEPNQVS